MDFDHIAEAEGNLFIAEDIRRPDSFEASTYFALLGIGHALVSIAESLRIAATPRGAVDFETKGGPDVS